jgi:DNA-binding CsgD family transcriptional regulator
MSADLTSRQIAVLGQLAIGMTRLAIARELHLSPRVIDMCTREIKLALASSHRVCLGVRAVRFGYLQPETIVCATDRPSQGWTAPNPRQLAIVTLLANGEPMPAVARRLGLSVSTVRADLYRLAADNAANTLVHLGALVQALDWLTEEALPCGETADPPLGRRRASHPAPITRRTNEITTASASAGDGG